MDDRQKYDQIHVQNFYVQIFREIQTPSKMRSNYMPSFLRLKYRPSDNLKKCKKRARTGK